MATKYSIQLANKLRFRLFQPEIFRDHKVRYDARGERSEAVARNTWAVHGVCLECRCWSITGGRCVACGIDYSPEGTSSRSLASEAKVRKQLELAAEVLSQTS